MAEPPVLTCAGRTDAGVHARGQVVHVDLPPVPFDGVGLARALNRQLSPSIVVLSATAVPDEFDARRSATARRYRYLVWNAPATDPLLHPTTWHVRDPLDLRAMSAASDVLLGTHDFRSFCRRKPGTSPEEPIMRRVTQARVVPRRAAPRWPTPAPSTGGGSCASRSRPIPSATRWCARSSAAWSRSGGGGAMRPPCLERLRSVTRHRAADPAPAQGLCLVSVRYG